MKFLWIERPLRVDNLNGRPLPKGTMFEMRFDLIFILFKISDGKEMYKKAYRTVLGLRVRAPSVNKAIYIFGETVNTCTISCSLRRYISHADAKLEECEQIDRDRLRPFTITKKWRLSK